MSPHERAAKFNASGVFHAVARDDGFLDVYIDDAVGFAEKAMRKNWPALFAGGRFCSVKLEVENLLDRELEFLGDAMELKILNVKGNRSLTGAFLGMLPEGIGLESIDVAITGIGDNALPFLAKFPTLRTVWGHRGQFSDRALAGINGQRSDLTFRLIY